MEKQQIYESLNRAYFSEDHDEKEILAWLAPIVSRAKCFVDIGASLGQYTRFAARSMKGGVIYAIEADPVRFEELQRNCDLWQQETGNEVHAVHAAVADYDGTITFNTTDSVVSGALTTHTQGKSNVDWREVTVPAMTLDTFFRDKKVDLVKMDIEGAELAALKGARSVLAARVPMFVELHSWGDPEGVLELMKTAGYGKKSVRGRYYFAASRSIPTSSLRSFARRVKSRISRWLD